MPTRATILLVEDEKALLHGIVDLLEVTDLGYELQVMVAENGRQGLQAMGTGPPDLIVSDIMMPEMDGFQFLDRVRQNRDWLHIPFIFLTAKGNQTDIHEGRISGADLYITKPFDTRDLLELIKTQLDRTFALQRVHQSNLNSLKRNIIQILNHEFRTPLTHVTAYGEMLADSLVSFESGEELEEYLRGIQTGCVRLTRLLDDLITVVELRTGEVGARLRAVVGSLPDIAALFRATAEAVAPLARAKNVTLTIDVPETLPTVEGDADALRTVFTAIIENAVKFTAPRREGERRVTVTARAEPDTLVFSIADTGIGFPQHIRQQIFEPFFQHNRSHMEQQGSGNGLAIAQGLVQLHGGRIDVVSEPNEGSTFEVVLPRADVAPAAQPSPATGAPAVAKPIVSILVVEDDHFLRAGLGEILEMSDDNYTFQVRMASDGLEGMERIEESPPDLIISDIMMPNLDGYGLLDRVRQNSDWLHIPFIFLTAKGDRRARHEGLKSGVTDYIAKPYDSDQLVELVTTILNRHFQVRDIVDQSFNDLKRSILQLLQPDFRRPLTDVSAHSERLAEALQGAETESELKESLQGIQTGSQALTRLVEDFITLAELRAGRAAGAVSGRHSVIKDPAMLLLETVQMHAASGRRDAVQLIYTYEPSDAAFVADRYALQESLERVVQVLGHYARGADRAEIEVSLTVTDDECRLNFSQRVGRFPDDIAVDIQAYFTGESGDILSRHEFGPSLTIVNERARLHGGHVVLAIGPDAGFTLSVVFPRHDLSG